MSLSDSVQIFPNDIHDTDSSAQLPVGTLGETTDGRKYRYASAGGADLDPGKLTVAATQLANHENMTPAVTAIGATKVTVTLGATAATANFYANGYLVVNDVTGEGIAYRVTGHPAADSAATLVVTIAEPITVALDATSQVSLVANPYKTVVISATDQADMPVGVPNVTISSGEYGWIQTGGVASVWADEAITAGLAVTTGTGTAGQVEAKDGAGEPQVGVALQTAVDTEYRAINLTID